MNKIEEFYLKNYPYARNGMTEIREAKGFAFWWEQFFARQTAATDDNIALAIRAWRHARNVSV